MRLFIIRHGEPDYTTDTLTENGKKQAEALADRLCTHGIDEIYVSPLGRAIQTAQPTCARLNLSYAVEEWMSEENVWKDFSVIGETGERGWAYACQNTKMKNSAYPSEEWYKMPAFSNCNSPLENYKRISESSDDFIKRLGYQRIDNIYKVISPNDKKIAAFCHHGSSTIWLSHMLSIAPNIFWSGFDIAHSSVTILEFRNNPDGFTAPQCMCLSDVSHIYKEDLPILAAIEFFK